MIAELNDLDLIKVVGEKRREAAGYEAAARKPLRQHGLELGVYFLLDTLHQHLNCTARPSILARQIGVTTGGATRLIDRAVLLGYVQRKPDPNDARGCLAVMTYLGAQRHEAATPTLAAALRGYLTARGVS